MFFSPLKLNFLADAIKSLEPAMLMLTVLIYCISGLSCLASVLAAPASSLASVAAAKIAG